MAKSAPNNSSGRVKGGAKNAPKASSKKGGVNDFMSSNPGRTMEAAGYVANNRLRQITAEAKANKPATSTGKKRGRPVGSKNKQ